MLAKQLSTDSNSLTMRLSHSSMLGESLIWDSVRMTWYWTDIDSCTIHALNQKTMQVNSYRLPDRVGCLGLTQSGRLILGLAKRLCLARIPEDRESNGSVHLHLENLCVVDALETRTRVNDGRVDRNGNFVFGTLNESSEKREIGSFYQYSMKHGLRRLSLPTVAIANSVCFSIDGKTMYFTDTLTRIIHQCDYDSDAAQVSNVRVFVRVEEEGAYPDGSIIDINGCLWNAQWGAASVVQYSPHGELLQRFTLATSNPTCPAFGGQNLNHLMVTSARKELSADQLKEQPYAGCLFGCEFENGIGVPDTFFNDTAPILSTETQ